MTKHLGMIALGLALTLGTATASWAKVTERLQNRIPGTAAAARPLEAIAPPGSNEPDRCFAPSPWGYQWVCG